jgi:hypothetical protein
MPWGPWPPEAKILGAFYMAIDPEEFLKPSKNKGKGSIIRKVERPKKQIKAKPPIVQPGKSEPKPKKCSFLVKLLLFLFFCGSVIFFLLWWDSHRSANSQDSNQSSELEKYKKWYQQEKKEKAQWQTKYDNLENKIANAFFYVGERDWSLAGNYDADYKMFFYVYRPILLKSVYVASQKPGTIRIMLCNLSNDILRETGTVEFSKPQTWQEVDLDFKINEGRYYLTFKGDTKLFFHLKNLKYPYQIDGIIKITGCDFGNNYEKQEYYQYFYGWKVALLME